MKPKKSTISKKSNQRKMNPVVHFEMPSEDGNRMATFYKKAFGWQMKKLGKKMGDYILATTTDVDKAGRPKETGMINGGFYPRKEDMPAQYPSVVVAVDDLNESMKKIEKAGSKVLGEPVEIPGFGMYISFLDTENNRVSIIEPFMKMK